MAPTAEKLQIKTEEFDGAFAETQFSTLTNYGRLPESEIYGRSLSTPYKLGLYAVGHAMAETVSSPEAAQAKAEFFTSVEEGFGTDMELGGGLEVRDFDERAVIGGKVMSKDLKRPISKMTRDGLICAEETSKEDGRFRPQLTRSRWDHENALIVDEMAQGKTGYNTRIVVSPFPEEAVIQSGDKYWRDIGYVPHLRRGFVQLYHLKGDKELLAGSLSFDGCDKERLRTVFKRRGIQITENEITDNWLQYAFTGTMSEEAASALALELANEAGDPSYKKTNNTVEITREHRVIMEKVFDESYIHACESLAIVRQTPEARKLIFQLADKAHHFNSRYAKALYGMRADAQRFTDDDMVVIHELLVYSTIEMMRALHTESSCDTTNNFPGTRQNLAAQLRAISSESFQNILGGFGAIGAINDRIYSACGLSISLGGNNSENNPQNAFGGQDKQEWYGRHKKKGICVNCKEETEVGEKDWCKKCISGHCGIKNK